jgi:hypothetical protein
MTAPVQATRQFKANFQAVCRRFGCTQSEIEEMTVLARADMTAAGESFAAIAKEIA